MPRDVKFFDLLIEDGANLLAAARELHGLMRDYDDLAARIARIQVLEHKGDEIGDRIEERLEGASSLPSTAVTSTSSRGASMTSWTVSRKRPRRC